jgi:Lon protease-like protein
MAINKPYADASGLPPVVPVFPLATALLLPRGELPLNIFEPRYVAMIDAALSGPRLIGMIQPALDDSGRGAVPALCDVGCIGKITSFQESGDGRYLLSLTGIARFRVVQELTALTPYRQCRVAYEFPDDFTPRKGEDKVDRVKLLAAFRRYLAANSMEADWDSVNAAPNEALVNALSMMAPYGPREKQALLEARTLADRSEMLVAMTEMALADSAGVEKPRLN